MALLRTVLPLALLFTATAQADGMSYLGMLHPEFKCRQALRVFRGVKAPALSVLWGTFGKDLTCYRKFIERHPDATVIIYFSNEACRRWGRCKAGELFKDLSVSKYNRRLISRPNRLRRRLNLRLTAIKRAIVGDGPGEARIILSTGLEDNLSCKAVKSLVSILREAWPYEISRNPMAFNRPCGADLLELHGAKPTAGAADVWSNDGTDLVFGATGFRGYEPHVRAADLLAQIRANRGDETIVLLWIAQTQGLYGTGGFSDPRSRVFTFSTWDVLSVNRLLRRVENVKENY